MQYDIYIIEDEAEFLDELKKMFKNDKNFHFISMTPDNIDIVLKNIPSMIIINDNNPRVTALEICQKIRTNDDNSITPILVISSNSDNNYRIEILKLSVQYYILKPINEDFLYYTVKNMIDFVATNRRISPLTGLPGNVQIQTEIKKRLLSKEDFAVIYLDLDNFKAYNDVYGFSNGDEIIKFAAKTIVKHVHEIPEGDNFVGHIGRR